MQNTSWTSQTLPWASAGNIGEDALSCGLLCKQEVHRELLVANMPTTRREPVSSRDTKVWHLDGPWDPAMTETVLVFTLLFYETIDSLSLSHMLL